MYRTAYQRGMLTIFFSVGSKPLEIWDVVAKDGYVSRFLDQDIKSMVLEIRGTNVSTTYMICPSKNRILGISMPFLVMIVKNLKKYFSFEVTILDETGTRRRFRVSNFQSSTQILPMCTAMPIGLSDGWNQIQFNLAEFTRRAYKKQFVEVQNLKINANIRLRRVYFTERLIPEDELPPEYKLYFPLPSKGAKGKKGGKENEQPSTSQPGEMVAAKDSKTVVLKPSSKTSVHSIKVAPQAAPSKAGSMERGPGGEVAAPVDTTRVGEVTPEPTGEGEGAADEGKGPEVADAGGEAPAQAEEPGAEDEPPAEHPAEQPTEQPAEISAEQPAEQPPAQEATPAE